MKRASLTFAVIGFKLGMEAIGAHGQELRPHHG